MTGKYGLEIIVYVAPALSEKGETNITVTGIGFERKGNRLAQRKTHVVATGMPESR